MGYREMAAREREFAEAAKQRAREARATARDAAFHDTAVTLSVHAANDESEARSHLESARRYEQLADQHGEPAG